MPDSVFAQWSDDEFNILSSTELSGTEGENEGTIAWDTTLHPFPLHLSVDTRTGSSFVMEVGWLAGGPNEEAHTLNEDFEWGILVPGGDRVWINFYPDEYVVDHDVSITLDWGEGTPVAPTTFGGVKALCR